MSIHAVTSPNTFYLANILMPIINAMPQAVLVVDTNGHVLLSNDKIPQVIPHIDTRVAEGIQRLSAVLTLSDEDEFLRQIAQKQSHTFIAHQGKMPVEVALHPFQLPQTGVVYFAYLTAWQNDINDLTRYEEEPHSRLQLHDQRYRIMIERMQQGIAVHNETGHIIYVNNAFCKMLGYKPHEILGQPHENFFVSSEIEYLREQTHRREKGISETYEIQMRHRDGRIIYVIISSSPYYDVADVYNGAFGVFTDISQHKRTEEALVKSNAELDAFAHTVAHDLKNPLSVLMGFADLLESEFKKMPPNEVEYYLQTVGRTADKMINIIDELLLLSQMRYAEVKLTSVDIKQLISECLQRTRYMQLQYSAEINVIDADKFPEVISYSPWIESAIVNYITNAIKYGGNPPVIDIGVSALSDGRVRIWVRDNGAGIPQDKIGRVFVEFDRLEEVRKKGYGIGLSIVKRIMEKLDGEVHVESRVGEGSIFSLLLPAPAGV